MFNAASGRQAASTTHLPTIHPSHRDKSLNPSSNDQDTSISHLHNGTATTTCSRPSNHTCLGEVNASLPWKLIPGLVEFWLVGLSQNSKHISKWLSLSNSGFLWLVWPPTLTSKLPFALWFSPREKREPSFGQGIFWRNLQMHAFQLFAVFCLVRCHILLYVVIWETSLVWRGSILFAK